MSAVDGHQPGRDAPARAAAGRGLAGAGGLRIRLRQQLAHRACQHRRLVGGGIRQLHRHGEDEDLDEGEDVVEPHNRFNLCRPGH